MFHEFPISPIQGVPGHLNSPYRLNYKANPGDPRELFFIMLRVSLWEPILDFYGRISRQLVGKNIAYFIWRSNTIVLVTQEYMSSYGTTESHLRRLQMQKLIFIEK